ncbi:MAG: helix-turn-helix domain-containing transcriptional regulator [Pseudobdellovibrionaceae bacterium]
MANRKTSTKPTKSLKKSTPKKLKIGGMTFTEHSPTQWIKDNPDVMLNGLIEALREGDKEAVQDIIGALVRSKNITEVARKSKISRTLIYEAIDKKKNPTLGTICKLMQSFAS